MIPDLETKMLKLAEAAETNPVNRVFVWRQMLTAMYQAGFEDGHIAAMRDRRVADILTDQEAKEAADHG